MVSRQLHILVASLDNKAEILRIDSKDRASLGLRGHTNCKSKKLAYHNHGSYLYPSTSPTTLFSRSKVAWDPEQNGIDKTLTAACAPQDQIRTL